MSYVGEKRVGSLEEGLERTIAIALVLGGNKGVC
jgi:hypothetical protein